MPNAGQLESAPQFQSTKPVPVFSNPDTLRNNYTDSETQHLFLDDLSSRPRMHPIPSLLVDEGTRVWAGVDEGSALVPRRLTPFLSRRRQRCERRQRDTKLTPLIHESPHTTPQWGLHTRRRSSFSSSSPASRTIPPRHVCLETVSTNPANVNSANTDQRNQCRAPAPAVLRA
uniref:Uncharacterized protein n=1 Tax=Mycena chlorophos TaxID=658473 RepID=A0ABQ0LV62_MYCCL|nr:predicted protein [Mycena chlorophos]